MSKWKTVMKRKFVDWKGEAYSKYDSQIEELNKAISELEDEVKYSVDGDAEKFAKFMDEIIEDLKEVSKKATTKVNDVKTYDW
jgi:prefoldin subunit 5